MKNLIKVLCAGLLALGLVFMFTSTPSVAQGAGPLPGDWVCCQVTNGPGCVDRLGMEWPEDEKRFTPTCSGFGG